MRVDGCDLCVDGYREARRVLVDGFVTYRLTACTCPAGLAVYARWSDRTQWRRNGRPLPKRPR